MREENRMQAENEDFSPDFLRRHLKVMADVDIGEQAETKFHLLAGLVAMIKMLQPDGYQQAVPTTILHLVKE